MSASADIPWMNWVLFVGAIIVFLSLDLGVFHRHAREVKFKEAIGWTILWFSMAMAFFVVLRYLPTFGPEHSELFLTGYLIELSLSMDNVFVIAMIFKYFRVPLQFQHRVLFWGILGALVMRGLMIWLGVALIERFHWTLYIFGVFLLFTGLKMIWSDDDGIDPDKNPIVRLARRFFRVSKHFSGQRFITVEGGRRILTPLALVLVMVETTDLVFALDSIPAIFGITHDPFIVFTSNVFAILGLRSLYFVLAGAIKYFCYLKYGLALVLVLIGTKMLIVDWIEIPVKLSLAAVVFIILASVFASVWALRRSSKTEEQAEKEE